MKITTHSREKLSLFNYKLMNLQILLDMSADAC